MLLFFFCSFLDDHGGVGGVFGVGGDGSNVGLTAKKRKTGEQQDDSVEISFHSAKEDKVDNETENETSATMDGLDFYLPTRTMTAAERARHRQPKRKQDIPTAGAGAVAAGNTHSDILMEGRKEVWQDEFEDTSL